MFIQPLSLNTLFSYEYSKIANSKDFSDYSIQEFCTKFLKNPLWDAQLKVLEAIERGDRKITWRSGHGVGKTNTAACAVIRFLLRWYGKAKTKVISTAPTARQVEKLLWSEINSLWPRSKVLRDLAEPLNVSLKINADCEAYGFTTDQADKFQGIHAEKLLIIIDEANGFPDFLFDPLEACLTGEGNQLLAIGNPVNPEGRFYDLDNDPAVTHFVTSSREHPNVIQGKEVIKGAVTQAWIDDYEKKNSAFPDLIKSRIDAQWPSKEGRTPFSEAYFNKALQIEVATDFPVILSVDIARFGNDKTVVTRFDGQKVVYQTAWEKTGIQETAERIRGLAKSCSPKFIVVDDDGVGGGVTDILRQDLNVIAFHNSGKAVEEERFANVATEAYWHTRQAFNDELLSLKHIETNYLDDLKFELLNRQYKFNSKGQVILENKEQFKKRTNRGSPDFSDSFCMGVYYLLKQWRDIYHNG